jgi:hypothetical protein
MYVIGRKTDFYLIKFPFIFPLVYFFILYFINGSEAYLVFFTLLFLAEPHFGATFPFLIYKKNFTKILDNKIYYLFIPILIVIFCISGFFTFNYLFLLIFFGINLFHVTRQSSGISKLYIKNKDEHIFHINFIYLFGLLFFLIGILRFYVPIINSENILFINILVLCSLFTCFIFYIFKYGFSSNIQTLITGCLIFYPICFVSNPIHGIIMGVTMHYTQYLALTYKITTKRLEDFSKKIFLNYKFISTIILYGTVMSILSLSGKNQSETIKALIVIPIIGQMLHFYYDSLLWKFSDPHNRENVLRHIF